MHFRQSAVSGSHVKLLALIAIGGCATGPDIRYDYDRSADFGAYRTYNFMEGAGPDTGNYQSLFTRYMIEAITIEMENRGYTKSDNPDLLVNFNANLQEKTKVTTSPAPVAMGGYYSYRRGYYTGWGVGYGYATETHVSQYKEGTLNIDIVDAAKKQLVWEAVGVGRVTEEKLENIEKSVKEAVPKLFAGYPFEAGRSDLVTNRGSS